MESRSKVLIMPNPPAVRLLLHSIAALRQLIKWSMRKNGISTLSCATTIRLEMSCQKRLLC